MSFLEILISLKTIKNLLINSGILFFRITVVLTLAEVFPIEVPTQTILINSPIIILLI